MLKVNLIEKKYKNNIIYKDTNLEINNDGEIDVILGESGSGKSTLLNILLGLDQDFNGEVEFLGKNIKKFNKNELSKYRAENISCVFQDFKLFENLSVIDNIQLANFANKSEEYINDLLKSLKIDHIKDQKVVNISGGQKQRVAIARTLMNEPQIIVFDEPTTGLDEDNVNIFIEILNDLKDNIKIIIFTHDKRLEEIANKIYKIKDKKLELLDGKDKKSTPLVVESKNGKNRFNFVKISRTHWKSMIYNIIVTTILMFIFIGGFIVGDTIFGEQFKYLYNGINDNVIVVNSMNLRDQNFESGEWKDYSQDRIFWSEEDAEKIRKLNGVENVFLMEPAGWEETDINGNRSVESLNPEKLEEYPSYANAPKVINLQFKPMDSPQGLAKDYIPNAFGDSLVKTRGEYPKDNSNEILAPDFIVKYFGDDVIGKEIPLHVQNSKGKEVTLNYKVVGLYQTRVQKDIYSDYELLIGYRDGEAWGVVKTDADYQEQLETYNQSSKEYKEAYKHFFKDKASLQKALGTNKSDMVVVTKDYESAKAVAIEMEKMFPENKVISQYDYREGQSKPIYDKIRLNTILFAIAISSIFAILTFFIFRGYYDRRIREIALLQTIGFKKAKINRMLLGELLFVFLLSAVLALIMLYILYLNGFEFIFSFTSAPKLLSYLALYITINIGLIYLIIFNKIKYKNIIKYIK